MSNGFEALTTKGTLEGWQMSIGKYCLSNSRLTFAVSLGFASALLKLAKEGSGGFHLVGLSSIGKTTLLRAIASVQGTPKLVSTWRGTTNGIEAAAAHHNDHTMPIDEISEVSAKEVANLIYMLGNGAGKKRATQTGGSRAPAEWRMLFASSGELTLAAHAATADQEFRAGVEVRCPNIEADAGTGYGVFEHLHGAPDSRTFSQWVSEAAMTDHGHPYREFIQWLVNHRVRVEGELPGLMAQFVNTNASSMSSEVQRIGKRFALVAAAGEYATEAGVTGWSKGDATAAAEVCFQTSLKLRGTTGESDTEKGVKSVLSFIEEHGASRFHNLDCKNDQKIHKRAGYYRNAGDVCEYDCDGLAWPTCDGQIWPTWVASSLPHSDRNC